MFDFVVLIVVLAGIAFVVKKLNDKFGFVEKIKAWMDK